VGPTMPGLRAVVETDPTARRVRLIDFRAALYRCLGRRTDALFELVDAVLTTDAPMVSLAGLSEQNAFRRGHGALYDALACGAIDVEALGGLIADSWESTDDGPVKIAVDVSPWARPDAPTSEGRCHCYASCRCDGARKTIPGWPFSVAAGLEWGASSWTAPLDAHRIGPDDDATVVTVAQIGVVTRRLAVAGHLDHRPAPVFAFDSGYDLTRITYLAGEAGVAVQVLGRVRSDRVFYGPPRLERIPGAAGRPPKHGERFELAKPTTLPTPDQELESANRRYGRVRVSAWHGLHQRLSKQAGWQGFPGLVPVLPGTVIRVAVERLPGNRAPQDLWLWHTAPTGTVFDLDLLWKTYLRRFDIEHTFKLFKAVLGWTTPQIRTPGQGERWTWLILAAYSQLRLARTLTLDLRRPWEKQIPAGRPITPGRVRRGFRTLRRHLGTPARRPKSTIPGPGRPKGTTRPPRPQFPVGKKPELKRRRASKDDRAPADATNQAG
jgi:hypothetical protein